MVMFVLVLSKNRASVLQVDCAEKKIANGIQVFNGMLRRSSQFRQWIQGQIIFPAFA